MVRILTIAQRNLLIFCLLYISLFSCTPVDENASIHSARVIITLVDSPAEYREVNIDLQEISLKTDGTKENDGWITLPNFTPGAYNILEFTGGQQLPLADMEFPSGTISQIKVKLGKNNTLKIGDHISNLMLANAYANGYIFNVHEVVTGGSTYYYRIDFDAAKSVTSLGSTGQLLLKPVVKLISESSTGSISGKIEPAEKNVLVNVIVSNTIVASSYAPENSSNFFIPGLEAGIYDISFESSDNDLQQFERNVSVSVGYVTDMGMIYLDE